MLGPVFVPPDTGLKGGDTDLAKLGCSIISEVQGSHTVATFGPYVIGCSGVDAGVRGLDAFNLANSQVVRQYGRVAHLIIFCEGCSIPTRQERASMVDILRAFDGQIAATGVVLLDREGLVPVLLGSLTRIVTRIAHCEFERRTFLAIEGSAQWLSGKLPQEFSAFPPEHVERVTAQLVRRFRDGPSAATA